MERYILSEKDGAHEIEYCGYTIDGYYVFQFVIGGELYYASKTKLETLKRI